MRIAKIRLKQSILGILRLDVLLLANFSFEYVNAWRADSAFWEGIPLNDCQWKERIFIKKILPCVNLMEYHRMAATGRTGVG